MNDHNGIQFFVSTLGFLLSREKIEWSRRGQRPNGRLISRYARQNS